MPSGSVGQPSMQTLEQVRIGSSVKEVLECDLAAEVDAYALHLAHRGVHSEFELHRYGSADD